MAMPTLSALLRAVDRHDLVEVEIRGNRTIHGDADDLREGLLILEDAAGDFHAVPIVDITSMEVVNV